MALQGVMRNGVVVLENGAKLPEGTRVEILALEELPMSEELLKFAGKLHGPKDFARNHDHYIHGAPKK